MYRSFRGEEAAASFPVRTTIYQKIATNPTMRSEKGTQLFRARGKSHHFCLERCRMAFAKPTCGPACRLLPSVSRCFLLLYRHPVLRLFCTDGTSSAQWTVCVLPCTCRQYAGKRQGKVEVQVATTHLCKRSCCQDIIVPLRRNSNCTAKLLAVHAASGHEA